LEALVSRPRDPHDSLLQFDLAAAAYENSAFEVPAQPAPAHDTYGPMQGLEGPQPAPVYASPSLVPSARFDSTPLDAASFDDGDEVYPSTPRRPIGLYAGVGAALLAGALFVGNHFVTAGRAEEQRLAEIARVQQSMAELEAKRRADEARQAQAAVPTQPTSSVAALLAASTQSHGAAQLPQAQKPNSLSAARQAAAIQRALAGPGVARRGKLAGRKVGAPKGAASQERDALQETRSNDPIYGL